MKLLRTGWAIAILTAAGFVGSSCSKAGTEPASSGKASVISVAQLSQAVDHFQKDCGRYPTMAEGLGALVQKPSDLKGWAGPYIEKSLLTDPSGRPYQYTSPASDGHHYQIEGHYGSGKHDRVVTTSDQ